MILVKILNIFKEIIMVRKYEPGYKFNEYIEEPSLIMAESKYGKFVKLDTFKHETARLNAQVARQKKQIAQLEKQIKLKEENND